MSGKTPGAGRVVGLIFAAILLFVGAILIVIGRSVISELQGGFFVVGGICLACAFAIFGMQSARGSAGVGLLGLTVLGAFVFFFIVLMSRG
jgi:hypothetical protein